MHKKICFIHTSTNGLHKNNVDLNKKNLYCFSRLVVLNYEIGYVENKKYNQLINETIIIKPNCMYIYKDTEKYHGITQEYATENGLDINIVLEKFKNDIKDVNIIVSHNIDFHLKTILGEYLRYNININLTKYLIIDTISFFHNFGLIKLNELSTKLLVKNIEDKNNIELIRDVFFKLYHQFEKSIKKNNI